MRQFFPTKWRASSSLSIQKLEVSDAIWGSLNFVQSPEKKNFIIYSEICYPERNFRRSKKIFSESHDLARVPSFFLSCVNFPTNCLLLFSVRKVDIWFFQQLFQKVQLLNHWLLALGLIFFSFLFHFPFHSPFLFLFFRNFFCDSE